SIANSPFQNDFFLILNVAMGGNLGGTIASNFTEDSMEIDYVRVYQ
ncbi:MAG: beta-glucanase (GH16 family), partial [Psychroserpens sp.]